MSSPQGNRRRFSENISAPMTSQILATLRSAMPSPATSISQSQASQMFPNSNRSARLSEFANMLNLPNVLGPSGRLVPPRVAQSLGGASVHPSFRSKAVCALGCKYCGQNICLRGMKAILLSDTRVELYSTDSVPSGRIQLVGDDYLTGNCHCRIRDVACLGCGNVCGYHVTQPCDNCMSACNNGHFWMFHDDAVRASERQDPSGTLTMIINAKGKGPLLWAQIAIAERDEKVYDRSEIVCR